MQCNWVAILVMLLPNKVMTINIMTNILHNNHDICELIFTSNTPRSDVNMQKKNPKNKVDIKQKVGIRLVQKNIPTYGMPKQ